MEHAHASTSQRSVRVFVATLSDTRDLQSDRSGALIRTLLAENGHAVAGAAIWREDAGTLRGEIDAVLQRSDFDALVMTGGTGIAPRDVTFDLLAALYERPLPGFGELFRMLSYEEIGSAAYLSRASAGVARGKVIFSLPGSLRAVRLGMQKLLLPELGHVVAELQRSPGGAP
jgi:molybdenum cofactor biosynthesis protein B